MSASTSPVEAALNVAAAVRADVTDLLGGRGGVVLEAVAGAGKSTFISETVGLLAEGDVTIAVAAPTNDQVFVLVAAIARAHRRLTMACCMQW